MSFTFIILLHANPNIRFLNAEITDQSEPIGYSINDHVTVWWLHLINITPTCFFIHTWTRLLFPNIGDATSVTVLLDTIHKKAAVFINTKQFFHLYVIDFLIVELLTTSLSSRFVNSFCSLEFSSLIPTLTREDLN